MAYKKTEIYKFKYNEIGNIKTEDNNKEKIIEIFLLIDNVDIQELQKKSYQYKIPLNMVIDNKTGNNLIHAILFNERKTISEYQKLVMIQFLVQNNCNPDHFNKNNQTPLHIACVNQYKTIVDYLLSIHVNINAIDSFGRTAFHYLFMGKRELVPEDNMDDYYFTGTKKSPPNIDPDEFKNILNKIEKSDFFESFQETLTDYIKESQEFIDSKKEITEKKITDLLNRLPENKELLRKIIINKFNNKWT
jgi:uncharacterized protein (UPF0262 family)